MPSAADQNANIIFGAVVDDSLGDNVRVTVIATGFEKGASRPASAVARGGRSERERGRPALTEGFDVPGDVLEIPSFLRDD